MRDEYGWLAPAQQKAILTFLVVGLLLVACSRDGGEAELRKRAELYWGYRADGQLDQAYDVEYQVLRNQMDRTGYIRRFSPAINYRDAEIEEIKIDEGGEAADVRLKLLVSVRPMGAKNALEKSVVQTERWVKGDDGAWYHVLALGKRKK
jgi:hypothetical protein